MTPLENFLRGDDKPHDCPRLDIHITYNTTWYPGRAPDGDGIMCFDHQGRRDQVSARTWRDAADKVIEIKRKELT